ncbi:MAG: PilZ domain-containing protein [Planctomycetota bacterium]|uniref:PilZ domain-containing protein n=1 Tax=uncultured Gimesia sp. TaxID=1678688 RepID=UPI00261E92C7|nr:PilZ domain-containing protein [uncultured Gimesia sp.]
MSLISLEQYTEKQNRAISRVLDLLDRIEKRTNVHYSEKRSHERKDFRGIVWISIPDKNSAEDAEVDTIKVWSRSISQSGLSFIYPLPIRQTTIHVGVPVQGNQVTWFRSEVVRRKEVQEEHFWEYGVRFLGKVVD